MLELTKEELNLLREWFSSVQDLSDPDFLEPKDFKLAARIHEVLGVRVTNDIKKGCKSDDK